MRFKLLSSHYSKCVPFTAFAFWPPGANVSANMIFHPVHVNSVWLIFFAHDKNVSGPDLWNFKPTLEHIAIHLFLSILFQAASISQPYLAFQKYFYLLHSLPAQANLLLQNLDSEKYFVR